MLPNANRGTQASSAYLISLLSTWLVAGFQFAELQWRSKVFGPFQRAKWVKLSAFFGHNIARGSGGDDGMNPKPNKKMSLGAESYGTIACKGFFTQSQVLLSSIVVLKIWIQV